MASFTFIIYSFDGGGGLCATACGWRSENRWWESALSFLHGSPEGLTQAGRRVLCPTEPSHVMGENAVSSENSEDRSPYSAKGSHNHGELDSALDFLPVKTGLI